MTSPVEPAPMPGKIPTSVKFGDRRFSSRSDYEQHLLIAGQAESAQQLWSDSRLVAGIQRHWHGQGQTGCLFARFLSKNLDDAAWRSVVIEGPGTDADSLAQLAEVIASAIEDPDCEAVSILYPHITEIEQLLDLNDAVGASSVPIGSHADEPIADYVPVAWRTDVTGDGVWAWIMAFGPFAVWPATRQGPVLEIVVRVKPKPPEIFHRLNQDRDAAHLADIPPPRLSTERIEQLWQSTLKTTSNTLGHPTDGLSAAKVTFSVPAGIFKAHASG